MLQESLFISNGSDVRLYTENDSIQSVMWFSWPFLPLLCCCYWISLALVWLLCVFRHEEERRRREEEMMRHREQDDPRRQPDGFIPNYHENVSKDEEHLMTELYR